MNEIALLIAATLASGTPVALAGLGLLLNERSGVLNLGAEGIMLVAAVAGFATAYATGNDWLAFGAGALAGMAMALIFGVLVIWLNTNQYATGLALSLFGAGFSAFVGVGHVGKKLGDRAPFEVPGLADLPFLGTALFRQHPMVYLAIAATAAIAWFLYRSRAGLVLRGIFLMSRKEILWFYQEGASCIFPDAWEEFLRPIPPEERHDLMGAYARRLHSEEPHIRKAAAHAWSLWEAKCSRLYEDPALIERFTGEHFALAFARIENHYFQHRGFLRSDFQLVEDVHKIRHIPAVIVQGRYDIVCPMESAWLLHRAWPEAAFHVVPDAGHSATEPGTAHELVSATDRMRGVVR